MKRLSSGDRYQTLNLIEIRQGALLNNFSFFQKENPGCEICPVLKSNAYGHGLRLVGRFVDQKLRPKFICLDSLYEAYELRRAGIRTPLLLMGYTFPENFRHKDLRRLRVSLPVFEEKSLAYLDKYQPGIGLHLKIDSGMNRLGIKEDGVSSFIRALKKYPRLKVEGIYTHLADAENEDSRFNRQQIAVFKKVIKQFEKNGFNFKWKHLNATAGCLRFKDRGFNLVRLGLGFYGLSPFQENSFWDKKLSRQLKPALKLITHLVDIKTLKKGEIVSYGKTFKAKKGMKIGVLPLGYYDGLDRRLSNQGLVKIGKAYGRILGKVCMNVTVVDLSQVKNPRLGQRVIVFDDQAASANSIKKTAELTGTIPYEILVNLAETTRRILI